MSHKIMSIKIVIIKYVFDRSIHFVTSHLMNYVKYDVIFQMPIIIVFRHEKSIGNDIFLFWWLIYILLYTFLFYINRAINSTKLEFDNFKIMQTRKRKIDLQEELC